MKRLNITEFMIDQQNQNITMTSGRVVPLEAVWGERPSAPVELGRQAFMHAGSGPGMDFWTPFVFLLDAGRRTVPLLVLYAERDGETHILHVIVAGHGSASEERADLLQVRDFELQASGSELRNTLLNTVVSVDASELLWSYALRRLFRLAKSPDEAFDNVFNQRFQKAGIARRLDYAAELLISNGFSRSVEIVPAADDGNQEHRTLKWVIGGPTDGRIIRDRFLRAFERAPNARAAAAAVIGFTKEDQATHVTWTDEELSGIRRRVEMVWNDPKHPVHELDEQRAKWVNKSVKRVLGMDASSASDCVP